MCVGGGALKNLSEMVGGGGVLKYSFVFKGVGRGTEFFKR